MSVICDTNYQWQHNSFAHFKRGLEPSNSNLRV